MVFLFFIERLLWLSGISIRSFREINKILVCIHILYYIITRLADGLGWVTWCARWAWTICIYACTVIKYAEPASRAGFGLLRWWWWCFVNDDHEQANRWRELLPWERFSWAGLRRKLPDYPAGLISINTEKREGPSGSYSKIRREATFSPRGKPWAPKQSDIV